MRYPMFLDWEGSMKWEKKHQANILHFKPFSSEKYLLKLPDIIETVQDAIIIDSDLNAYNLTFSDVVIINGSPFIFFSDILLDEWKKVRIKLFTDAGEYYSSLFICSNTEIENTSYLKFRDNKWQFFGGIRLPLKYWHDKAVNEITTYYEVITERTVTIGAKRDIASRFIASALDLDIANALCDLLTFPIVYWNGKRIFCTELPDIEDLQGDEYYTDVEFRARIDKKDTDNEVVNLAVYALGQRQSNLIIGDGNNNIINSNINGN